MKSSINFLIFFFINSGILTACCYEYVNRLYPVGELHEKVVFVEIQYSKNCRSAGLNSKILKFSIEGSSALVIETPDSLKHLTPQKDFSFLDCVSSLEDRNLNSRLDSLIRIIYSENLNNAKSFLDFKPAIPKSIKLNPSLELTNHFNSNGDTTHFIIDDYSWVYPSHFTFQVPKKVTEFKSYQTENFIIYIYRIRCNKSYFDEFQKEQFFDLEKAVWKEGYQSHGYSLDLWKIEKR